MKNTSSKSTVLDKDTGHDSQVQKIWQKKRKIFDYFFDNFTNIIPFNPNCTVAEFGVGKWGFGRFYAEKYKKVYGIDIEDYSSFHPNVEFILSQGVELEMQDQILDIVFSHSVLEHVEDLVSVISEINRVTKIGGYFYLTVNPLYYSSFGAHLYDENQMRIENWEHLDPNQSYYLLDNSCPDAITSGHFLNKLTSSKFLSAVSQQPWNIIHYSIHLENKPIPEYVDRSVASEFDLKAKAFRFIGQRIM